MHKLISIILLLNVLVITGCISEKKVQKNIVHSSDGVPIYYQSIGDGSATLVFVHGWSCNSSYWKKQVEYFQDKYQVVTIDLAGHGLSGKGRERYTIESYAEDVRAVVSYLKGPVILIGHSMAGEILVEASYRLGGRIKAVIGVDTLQDVSSEVTKSQTEQYLSVFDEDFADGVNVFVSEMFGPKDSAKLKESIIEQMSSSDANIATDTLKNYFDYYTSGKIREIASKTDTPIYCINADLWPTNVEGNKSIFPRYISCELIADSGHFIMLSNSEEFNLKLEETVQRILK